MPVGFWFWLLMVIWFLFGLWRDRPAAGQPYPFRTFLPGHVLLFLLFAFLGWHAFGAPWDALVNGR